MLEVIASYAIVLAVMGALRWFDRGNERAAHVRVSLGPVTGSATGAVAVFVVLSALTLLAVGTGR